MPTYGSRSKRNAAVALSAAVASLAVSVSCGARPQPFQVLRLSASTTQVSYGALIVDIPSTWPVQREGSACKAYGRSGLFVEQPVISDDPVCPHPNDPAMAVRLGPLEEMPTTLPRVASAREPGLRMYLDADGPVPHSFFLDIPAAHVQVLVTCGLSSIEPQRIVDSIALQKAGSPAVDARADEAATEPFLIGSVCGSDVART